MVQVPAFCDNCDNIFPSGMDFESTINVTMTGNKARCPKCKHWARIPDGVFNFYSNAIEVLQATETTVKDLQKFYTIIQNASKEDATPQAVKEEIEKEVPKLSFLAKYLPQNAKELGVYLTAIGSILNGLTGGSIEINPHIEINPKTEINQQIYVEQPYKQFAPALEVHTPIELPNRKIGRNESCPCESGIKYKYCHGK
ncbi:SEC-C metal-binding domain-containing protein [Peribacillus sp. NPDC060253]|uniref:SEC-C metal-binding domain-containing protein n=1 Tax=Peribacillus sp. NPDC060253 TaxID=3347084 RepID=UPI003661419C